MDLLLTEDWDLTTDGQGNIAVTPDNLYSIAQTTANEVKLFIGEGWYDRTQGVPYFERILGVNPNWGFIRNTLLQCALNVDGVLNAEMDLYVNNRQLGGAIYITSTEGATNVIYN